MKFWLSDKQNKYKILLFIILAIVKYYFIREYEKILYKILLLSENTYINYYNIIIENSLKSNINIFICFILTKKFLYQFY